MTNTLAPFGDTLDALLPCPFCGGRPHVLPRSDFVGISYLVFCDECKSSTPISETEDKARAAWNRRAALPAGNEPVARIAFSDVALLGDIFDFLGGVDGAASLRDRILAVMSPSVASPLTPAEGETAGFVLVPPEITPEMQRAYFDVIDKNMPRVTTDATFGRHDSNEEAYRAMLASRPTPTSGEKGNG